MGLSRFARICAESPFCALGTKPSGHGRRFVAESGSPECHRRLRQDDVMATTEGTGTNRWREELYEAKPERQGELFSTISGIENEPLYTDESVEIGELGFPGVYPFTRGVYPSMYRGRLWTMRQFAGFGTAEETNERFRYLLEHGQTGLSTAFDMPTLMGYDSDHPRSLGEVGREGVAI